MGLELRFIKSHSLRFPLLGPPADLEDVSLYSLQGTTPSRASVENSGLGYLTLMRRAYPNTTSMKGSIHTFLDPFPPAPKIICYAKLNVESLTMGRADHRILDIPHIEGIIKTTKNRNFPLPLEDMLTTAHPGIARAPGVPNFCKVMIHDGLV